MVVRGEQKDSLGVSGSVWRKKRDEWGGREAPRSLTPVRNLSHTTGLMIGPNTLVKQEDTDTVRPCLCLRQHVCTSSPDVFLHPLFN